MLIRTLIAIVLVAAGPWAGAVEIYRHQGGDGRAVEFSDKPRVGAEKVEIKVPLRPAPLPAAAAPATAGAAPASADAQPQPYRSLQITQPLNDDALRDNEGNVGVALQLVPPLQPQFGHSLVLLMDGRPVEAPGLKTSFELRNVDRGSHTLQAFVLDAVGKTVFQSGTTTFHLQRQIVRRKPAP